MEWLSENWIWVALIGGMGAMHLFGHRKGGGHGKSGGGCCGGGGHKHAEDNRGNEQPKAERETSA